MKKRMFFTPVFIVTSLAIFMCFASIATLAEGDITLNDPNGGEIIPSSSKYTIQWEGAAEAVSFKLMFSLNNGKDWKLIEKNLIGTSHEWQVPTPSENKTKCLVKVIGYEASGKKIGADKSDSTFTIEVIKVKSPDGGEILTSGNIWPIQWDTHETKRDVAKVKLLYTKNGGKTWNNIVTLDGNPGSYDEWTVPDVPKPKTGCRVKVVLKDAKGNTVGSDASDSDFTITALGTISGSVSGTTVVAVNENGDIVDWDDTIGKTPDANGNYPFILTVRVGEKIRVYVITRLGIYPMYFDRNGDGIPDTNVFSLTSATAVDLGFVDTDFEEQEGKAIPQNSPTNVPGVIGRKPNPTIPSSLMAADTTGLSLSELLTRGFDALKDGLVLQARDYFGAAGALLDGSEDPNDADTAWFFYALARVAALGFDTYSDGKAGDMNKLGDILDRFGFDKSDIARANVDAIILPEPLPTDSPDGSDIQDFLYTVVRPVLMAAVGNLDNISNSFNRSWIEPLGGETVESDYGDVLFFRALLKGTLASISIQRAYNLNADIDKTVNKEKTIEQFLDENPDFLTLSDLDKLTEAKGYLTTSALDDLDAAIDWMQAETDDQTDDFINLADVTESEIAETKADIVDAKGSLDEPTLILDNDDDPANDFTLDLSLFFAGLDFRTPNLLPPYTGNEPSGYFPDPAFEGIIGPEIDLNEDTDPADGIPDILQ